MFPNFPLNANKLSLNYTKTKYLLIKAFKNKCVESFDFDVKIKGVKIDRCYSIKYLGILLDEDLSWKPHISNLRKKLSQGVGIIAKMKNYLNKQNLIALYYTFSIHTFCTEFLVGAAFQKLKLNLFKFFKTKFCEYLTNPHGKIALLLMLYIKA